MFNKFKSGDVGVIDEEIGRPPQRFEVAELQALLYEDHNDDDKLKGFMAEPLNVIENLFITLENQMLDFK